MSYERPKIGDWMVVTTHVHGWEGHPFLARDKAIQFMKMLKDEVQPELYRRESLVQSRDVPELGGPPDDTRNY